jgi:RNA polymerase sigma-70 factor (ECF subfamily)
MTVDLLSRARAGDGDAFRAITEPYRRELQVHCYRMLGSLQDAEDVLQDAMLAAWRGLGGYEDRASIRTWLYRIATNRCLNALRDARRRPPLEWSAPDVEPPEPSRLGEVVWLQPYPDSLIESPEAHHERTEAMTLAFVTALQVLPARQRAALILCEVLGYPAAEVATMLDSTVDSVNSALKRARAALRRPAREPAPAPGSPVEQALVARFVRAYDTGDVEALVALLTEDVVLTMPPIPLEYHGRDAVACFFADVAMRKGRTFDLVPTRANGQPAFGVYLRDPDGTHAHGLDVLTLAGDRICAITHFNADVLDSFGLPSALTGRSGRGLALKWQRHPEQ